MRILILDNHGDFGGHAKRNKFRDGNNFRLGYGGTYAIESSAPYSQVAKALVEELGIYVLKSRRVILRSIPSSRSRESCTISSAVNYEPSSAFLTASSAP